MKIRFIVPIKDDPRIEIMPDSGKFDSLDAVITVSFFDWLEHEKYYRPLVRANVSFGNKMNPEDAMRWGECFTAAYQIATKQIPPYILPEQKDEVVKAFWRVDEIRKETA